MLGRIDCNIFRDFSQNLHNYMVFTGLTVWELMHIYDIIDLKGSRIKNEIVKISKDAVQYPI